MKCNWCRIRFTEDIAYCPQCGAPNDNEIDIAAICAEATRKSLIDSLKTSEAIANCSRPAFSNVTWRI